MTQDSKRDAALRALEKEVRRAKRNFVLFNAVALLPVVLACVKYGPSFKVVLLGSLYMVLLFLWGRTVRERRDRRTAAERATLLNR